MSFARKIIFHSHIYQNKNVTLYLDLEIGYFCSSFIELQPSLTKVRWDGLVKTKYN